MRKRRILLAGALLVAIVTGAGLIGLRAYLHSFTPYTDHDLLATVTCEAASPGALPVLDVSFVHGRLRGQTKRFQFGADEWVFEGRIIAWGPLLRILGTERYYSYERISGRYRDIEKEVHARRYAYALRDTPDALWETVFRWQRYIPFVSAAYGSCAYVPFVPGTRYQIYITATGFLIKEVSPPQRRVWWPVG